MAVTLNPEFTKGVYQALGVAVGGTIIRTAEPIIRDQADKADRYLNSFPIEKVNAEGKQEVALSTPEAIVLFGGIGAACVIAAPAVGIISAVVATAMKTRRMYANNECSIQ